MATLEEIQPNVELRGVMPDQSVTVVNVKWFGSSAIELTYKGADGRAANTLLFFADSIDGRTSLAKRLKKRGALVECKRLYGQPAFGRRGGSGSGAEQSELARWVAARASGRGLNLDGDAATFLIELAGDSLFVIDSELQKLEIACGDGGRVGVEPTWIGALRAVGGAAGNMICVHNVVAAAATVGLAVHRKG